MIACLIGIDELDLSILILVDGLLLRIYDLIVTCSILVLLWLFLILIVSAPILQLTRWLRTHFK